MLVQSDFVIAFQKKELSHALSRFDSLSLAGEALIVLGWRIRRIGCAHEHSSCVGADTCMATFWNISTIEEEKS